MSASSNRRRLKDINAGDTGANPSSVKKPSRSVTPLPFSGKNPSPGLQKSFSSKENPKPSHRSSGSTQKPVLRPVPRIDKSAVRGVSDGEGRVTRSMASAIRGRSSSPSDLIRVFSDSRRKNESRIIGESDQGKKSGYKVSSFKQVEGESNLGDRVSEETAEGRNTKANLSSGSVKSRNFDGSEPKADALLSAGEKSAVALKSDSKIEKTGRGSSVVLRRNSLDNSGKAMEISKEVRGNEGSSSGATKYPSKLHEKLAFLEGKVKKIASDIKKTKVMLDLNNPDSSKVIISDIQQKITGIEKSMSHVVDGPDEKKESEKSKTNQATKAKSTVKGLNKEELEDRLFPHHKLLRSRTQFKASSHVSKGNDPVESNKAANVEEKPTGPVEENEIALEFLASLDSEKDTSGTESDQNAVENQEVQAMDIEEPSKEHDSSKDVNLTSNLAEILRSDEALEEIDDEENREEMELEEMDDGCMYQLNDIGSKFSTGGWFVSEGEAVLLAHVDGSCSYYDVANCEEKAVYNPPDGISQNIWRDCWLVRAPGADGCSGRYVVAASAGNTFESGFCSWDFYTKDIKALHIENGSSRASRTALAPLSNNSSHGRNTLACGSVPEAQQWWYRPCGPLIVSTASSQRVVKVFDIRDGEQIMRWEVQNHVSGLEYSSPLQWRNRGKLVIAETEAISVWDVNSLHPEAQLTISSSGRQISALHINNTDAEIGGGVRQRVSSLDAEGNDGVFCTADSINILDFRNPSGIGAKIPKLGVNAQCVSSRGDSVYIGCSNMKSSVKKHLPSSSSQVLQFSLRKQRLVSTYNLPDTNSHPHHSAITQVWGNSNFVMASSGLGLFVFDTAKEESLQQQQPLASDYGSFQTVREIVGPNDMYCPSFDYSGSRVLVISRDRPALWRHIL